MNDVNLVSDVMVETRDGVRLATDIYFPARNGRRVAGKLPALLHRTPYNKTEVEATLGYCRYFASHGYVSIIQDCRGCYRSGGDVNFLFPEAEDGCDTMSWIDAQPWSDGQVGTWGTSWAGWTQTALAALGPRNLKTMVPNMSGSDGYSSSIRQGGALELRFLAWAFWHSAVNTQKALKFEPWIDAALNRGATRFREWLTRMPIRPGQTQLKLVPQYERWAFELLKSADYGDYWKHPSLAPELYWEKFPDIPVLWVGGWYDSYRARHLRELSRHAPAQEGAAVRAGWPLDARLRDGSAAVCGRRRIPPGSGVNQLPGRPPALVRSLVEGRRQRRRATHGFVCS